MALNYTNFSMAVNFTLRDHWNQSNGTSKLPSQSDEVVDTVSVLYATFYVLVLILAILGNSLVCFAVGLSPRLRANPTNCFVVSLAISDMGFAIFQGSIKASMKLNQGRTSSGIVACWIIVLSDLVTTPASIITLFVIAVDRFYCIKQPFLYLEKMKKKRARYIVLLIWLSACVVASLCVLGWNGSDDASLVRMVGKLCLTANMHFFRWASIVIILIPLVIMGFLYFTIWRIAMSHIRAIKKTEVSSSIQYENDGKECRMAKIKNRRTHRELRATRMLAIVYGAFVICWVPFCIINIIGNSNISFIWRKRLKVLHIIPMLSTAINPIIYNFSNKQFRFAFKMVIYRLVGKSEMLRREKNIEFGAYTKSQMRSQTIATIEMQEMNAK